MATIRVPWMAVALVMGLSLAGGLVWAAEGQVFDVQEQVKKGDQQGWIHPARARENTELHGWGRHRPR